MAEVKAIQGMILNTRGQPISGKVTVNLCDINGAVLITTSTDTISGRYQFLVMDGFRGRVSIPDQRVGNVQILSKDSMKNYAVVETPAGGYTYYVVVSSQIYDPMDSNFDGTVSFDELKSVVGQLQADVAELKKMMPK